jgi:hypothetical protein
MLHRRLYQLATLLVVMALFWTAATPSAVMAAALSPLAQDSDDEEGVESEWLVMLYQNADDEVLEGDIYTDLNEAELVGSTDDVIIVSQF